MIQNIRVDIVYYMMATDFEFEFNLGGCCHMRLLNGKAKDKKEYLNALARAVSRSQIIISCGPIFGEEGLISTTAVAINRELEAVDNEAYGISSEDKIEVIKGAVPLVTPEGYFGGCIIESGPQAIIILTENKMIRKSIMKNLIHPYIEDMSLLQSAGSTAPTAINNITHPTDTNLLQETEEDPEPKPSDSENTAEEILDNEPDKFLEPEDIEEEISQNNMSDVENIQKEQPEENHDIEFDFYSDDTSGDDADKEAETQTPVNEDLFIENDFEGHKKSGKGINISILIISVILLFAILGLGYFLVYLPMKGGISTTDYIKQLFDAASSTISV